MLYVRLTLRNLKRSVKEYGIFMLTMILSLMLIYSFMAASSSEEIQRLGKHMTDFQTVIIYVSIGIVVVIGWLISYISGFILRKRSREFGMYLLMGMRRKEVARMFLLEQFFMGCLALLIGCLLGILMNQILQAIIMRIFASTYTFSLSVSSQAGLITSLAFAFVYLIELAKERRLLMKVKIHDLLYRNDRNEQVVHKRRSTLIFLLIAVICAALGLKLFYEVMSLIGTSKMSGNLLMFSTLLIIASIYLFFLGFASSLQYLLDHFKRIKYHKQIMFLAGRLQGRLASNRIVLATLSLLILLIITFLCFAMKFKETTDLTIDTQAPFDLQMAAPTPSYIEKTRKFLNEKGVEYQDLNYGVYQSVNADHKVHQSFAKAFQGTPYENRYFSKTEYMRSSDFQKLLSFKGKAIADLAKGEYGIVVNEKQRIWLEAYIRKHPLMIDGKEWKLKYISSEKVLQENYYIILPDAYLTMDLSGKGGYPYRYVAESKEALPSAWEDDLYQQVFTYDEEIQGRRGSVILHSSYVEMSMFSYITIVFSLFYASFIFICAVGTILATQQLSDLEAQKYEYHLLSKMGVARKELHGLLRQQNAIYFLIPLLLPALYLLPILAAVDKIFVPTASTTPIYVYLGTTFILFGVIYFAYYLLTYTSCHRNLDR